MWLANQIGEPEKGRKFSKIGTEIESIKDDKKKGWKGKPRKERKKRQKNEAKDEPSKWCQMQQYRVTLTLIEVKTGQ